MSLNSTDGLTVAAIVAALVGLLAFFSKAQSDKTKSGETLIQASTGADDLMTIYRRHAHMNNLDWRLLRALAIIESSESPNAKNPADPSYGLMQVLCTGTGGNDNAVCKNRFNITGWAGTTPNKLYDPNHNVMLAAQIIKWNLTTYGWPKGIAVYNSWGARNDPPNGPFRNQGYVDKVLREFRALGGSA